MRKGILCVLCVEQMVSKSSLKLPVPTVFTSTTETRLSVNFPHPSPLPQWDAMIVVYTVSGDECKQQDWQSEERTLHRRVFFSLAPWQFFSIQKIGGNAQHRKLKIHVYFVLLQCTLYWSTNELINTWYEEKQNKLIWSNKQLEKKEQWFD